MEIFRILLLLLISVTVFSCKKEAVRVNQAPTIETFQLSNTEVGAGRQFTVNMLFVDDVNLASYHIKIRHLFDHGSTVETLMPFSYDSIINVSGQSFTDHMLFPVPDSVIAGPYQITVVVTDSDGDTTQSSAAFTIYNSQTPAIDVLTLSGTLGFSAFSLGDTIKPQGSISDGVDLAAVTVLVQLKDGHGKVQHRPIYNKTVWLTGNSDILYILDSLQPPIEIPTDADTGSYTVSIAARNALGHYAESTAEIEIHDK